MILKIECGVDMVRVSRIQAALERRGDVFLHRVFTPGEIEDCVKKKAGYMQSLAARFAAKEAASKALGTGIGAKGVALLDIETRNLESGKPQIKLYNKANQVFLEKGGEDISLSLSHEGDHAIAFCVMKFRGE